MQVFMKTKIFTIRWNQEELMMDDCEFQEFFADRELVSASDHFCLMEGVPTLFILACYRDLPSAAVIGRTIREPGNRKDPRNELSAQECVAYDLLREWRNAKAVAAGVPGYLVATNRQLAEISRLMPSTLAVLGEVDGIGEAKLKQHGQEILDIVRTLNGADSSGSKESKA